MSKSWHAEEIDEVTRDLSVVQGGLTSQEAQERLRKYGYNELQEKKKRTALHMFIGEFKDVFILLLIAATIFSGIIGYYELASGKSESFLESFADTITISAIVILVGVTGFIQEYRAEKAMEALKKLTAPKARVLRDGKETIIPAKELVPGDILVLEEGDHIPADARLMEVVELKTNEAVLTGESIPVNKGLKTLKESASISERQNMVFTATHVVYGRGKAVVVSTGMSTEFGKIAEMVQTAEEEETPLKKKLNRFAGKIGKIVIAVVAVIFAIEVVDVFLLGQVDIEGFIKAAMSAISLAISAVPEGLPAIVTVALALGAREFVKKNAIVRRLSAAEGLGAVTVICSDKTGTITKGEMTVRQGYTGNQLYEVTGVGYEPKGEFRVGSDPVKPDADLKLLLITGTLCNNASLQNTEGKDSWGVIGDPTEGALIVAAAKAGLQKEELEKLYPRVGEVPFTSERKRMTTIHKTPEGEIHAFMKGAPETVLDKCVKLVENGKEKQLTKEIRAKILRTNETLASNALRVLGMAYKKMPSTLKEYKEETVEDSLVFVGLEGMIDPPRAEVIEANKLCQKAGIAAVMITGDHRLTAKAVAKEVGIFKEDDIVLTGEELDKLDAKEFEEIVEKVTVYARVSPEHKLKIINALKKKGHVVAMTGDGVNDAPAVKAADVGVSMGISGTDVTREASDIVLTDDNFATIVGAVKQGRAIYDNVRKYARFLIACNFDELLIIGLFAILGGIYGEVFFPLPLLPAMILWINLVTDGAPAVALATDPPDVDVMDRPPRKPGEGILHGMGRFIIVSFLLQAMGTILVFCLEYYVWPAHPWHLPGGIIDETARALTYREATTTAFIQAALFELFVVWNCRSEKRSVWKMGKDAFKNKYFVIGDLASVALTLGISYLPITQQLFHLVGLSPTDLLYVALVGSWGLFVFPEVLMGKKLWKWS
jgi:Ca2+-transporting ATPase